MPGDTKINVHTDSCNFILTSHLALVVPENGNNKCRLTVGPDTREWLEGTSMVFDTSIFHDAINESDGTRYILMLRVWHPELMDVERDALQVRKRKGGGEGSEERDKAYNAWIIN